MSFSEEDLARWARRETDAIEGSPAYDRGMLVSRLLRERDKLRAENERLRAVANEARKLVNRAVPQWAPELRAALAAAPSESPATTEKQRP